MSPEVKFSHDFYVKFYDLVLRVAESACCTDCQTLAASPNGKEAGMTLKRRHCLWPKRI